MRGIRAKHNDEHSKKMRGIRAKFLLEIMQLEVALAVKSCSIFTN
jgi:hypothetical protein